MRGDSEDPVSINCQPYISDSNSLKWLSLPDHQNNDKVLQEQPLLNSRKETASVSQPDHQNNNKALQQQPPSGSGKEIASESGTN